MKTETPVIEIKNLSRRYGHLDAVNGQHVMDLLLEIRRARGATLVLATHDAALAASADVILRLRGGRIDAVEARQPGQAGSPSPGNSRVQDAG